MNEMVLIYHIHNNTKYYFIGKGGEWSADRSEAMCFSRSQCEHLLNDPRFTNIHNINILWEAL